jgi:hypothetical protein
LNIRSKVEQKASFKGNYLILLGYQAKITIREMPMKLKDRISWLMGTVQQTLFPCLDECLPTLLTVPEKRLVKILELLQIEKYVPVTSRGDNGWAGRLKSVKLSPGRLSPKRFFNISTPELCATHY